MRWQYALAVIDNTSYEGVLRVVYLPQGREVQLRLPRSASHHPLRPWLLEFLF